MTGLPYPGTVLSLEPRIATSFTQFAGDSFTYSALAVLERITQLTIDTDALADDCHRRREYVDEQARIEPGRLACITRKHDNQEAQHRAVVEHLARQRRCRLLDPGLDIVDDLEGVVTVTGDHDSAYDRRTAFVERPAS